MLAESLFSLLEKLTLDARKAAEAGAHAAMQTLAVDRAEAYRALSSSERALRNQLRARARQLGGNEADGLPALEEEVAYTQWHRLLFAALLAHNGLLRHPATGQPVSLEDCDELAPHEGAPDGLTLAARYVGQMLPGTLGDPAIAAVTYAPEHRDALQAIVRQLPAAVFAADDSLGWMYQFWQKERKAAINSSEAKIEGADLAPLTQVFTEDYMVRFLLENSLGAWWAARHPTSPLLANYVYLRRDAAGQPAAGTFSGWPQRAAEVTVLDPCCGSGHFMLRAYEMLRDMRREEEGLTLAEASDAVLRDNLFGLELDPRCTQIAAFSLALAAWKDGGYRSLPTPQVACCGLPVRGERGAWLALANGDERLRSTLEQLYNLFEQATTLGSLIDPTRAAGNETLFSASYAEVERLLERALAKEGAWADPAAALFGQQAAAVLRAATLLARHYTLVATNPPYLARGRQGEALKRHLAEYHPHAKADLATAFLERCATFANQGGSYALVLPQNWTFLSSYAKLRNKLLKQQTWHHLSYLGSGAFRTISGEVVNTVLLVCTNMHPAPDAMLTGIEADAGATPVEKERLLREGELLSISQHEQLDHPDARISLRASSRHPLLQALAHAYKGITSGDDAHYRRYFWELPDLSDDWWRLQSTVVRSVLNGGCESVLWHSSMARALSEADSQVAPRGSEFLRQRRVAKVAGVYIRAERIWGERGVAVSQMRDLPVALYTGEPFDTNVAVIVPYDPAHLPAIWCYCSSPEYARDVRRIDRSLKVTNATLVKVPFDLERWQRVAAERYPDGLPAPHSDDPTQWLFGGHPVGSDAPLQVAVARLLGYRWPQQAADALDPLVVSDGLLPLVAVGRQPAGEQRLRALLAAAYGDAWSAEQERALLSSVGYAGKSLGDWLREGFFSQHCALFHQRPFIWHIWDGRKDGFGALVNYHRLDRSTLGKLAYTYLGDWIATQEQQAKAGVPGAEARLAAAQTLQGKLKLIAEGEPPYDLYVRWKSRAEQPMGWVPDLNDGVRLNIRPWVTAGVLRSRVTVHWNKDRGRDPDGAERVNDVHLTLAEKREAREKAEQDKGQGQ